MDDNLDFQESPSCSPSSSGSSESQNQASLVPHAAGYGAPTTSGDESFDELFEGVESADDFAARMARHFDAYEVEVEVEVEEESRSSEDLSAGRANPVRQGDTELSETDGDGESEGPIDSQNSSDGESDSNTFSLEQILRSVARGRLGRSGIKETIQNRPEVAAKLPTSANHVALELMGREMGGRWMYRALGCFGGTQANVANAKAVVSSQSCNHAFARQDFKRIIGGKRRWISSLIYSQSLAGHDGCVNTLEFSPCGQYLLSGSDDMEVRIWNLPKADTIQRLTGHQSNVFCCKFLPASGISQVISSGNDAIVRWFDVETGRKLVSWDHHTQKVLSLTCNPFLPHCVVSASYDGSLRMFDTRVPYCNVDPTSGEDLFSDEVVPQSLGGGRVARLDADVSDDTSLVFNAATSGTSDANSSAGSSTRTSLASRHLFSACFNPSNHHQIALALSQRQVKVLDTRKGMAVDTHILDAPSLCSVTGIDWSMDGRHVVASVSEDDVFLIDMNASQIGQSDSSSSVGKTCGITRLKGRISSMTLKGIWFGGPNSEYILSGSDDSRVLIWDRGSGRLLRALNGHDEIVNVAVMSHNDLSVASSGLESQAFVWRPHAPPDPALLEQRDRLHFRIVQQSYAYNEIFQDESFHVI